MTTAFVTAGERRGSLRRMAQSCLLLTVLIITLSAFVRHRGAGPEADVLVARAAHRVVASVTLLLVIAMVLASYTARPALRREGALALGLLGLALGLAVLGVVTPGSQLPAVTLGNLLGGFAMLALCARLVAVTGERRPPDAVLARAGVLAAILLVLQVALGALVSATHAGLSCHSLAECTALAAGGGWDFSGLDPWRLPATDGAGLASGAAGAAVQWVHWVGGFVVAAVALAFGWLAWRRGRRHSALGLAALLMVVVALGIVIGEGNSSLPVVLLHNLTAASLLAVVLRLP
ncbi:MAG: COX15/CtaA family protein [Steroidobacteraceae bacterium]|nr:COX15/CtaA family protein [Steroidobacteraceae bacterium]